MSLIHFNIFPKLRFSLLLGATTLLSFVNLSAQTALDEAFASVLQDENLAEASISAVFMNKESNEAVLEHNADQLLAPASTMKALVTRTALEVFGPDHQFVTELILQGEVMNSELKGDVIIRGYGDPTFGSSKFGRDDVLVRWITALRKTGISTISGKLILDEGYFTDAPLAGNTAIADGGNYYAAGAHSINYLDNTFEVTLASTNEVGGMVSVTTISPQIPNLTLVSELEASQSKRDNAYIFGQPFDEKRFIRGSIPMGRKSFKIKGAMPHPAACLGNEFVRIASTKGMKIKGGYEVVAQSTVAEDEVILETEYSPKLSELVYYTNRKSVNLYAACLLKQLGMQASGIGSFQTGEKALKTFWRSKGLNVRGMQLIDGSGLSRANNLTSRQLAFINAYVGAGEEAYLKSLRPFEGRGSLLVKSGYINRVRAYTGRTTLQNGEEVAFAIIVNNYACTATEANRVLKKFLKSITLQ